MKHWLIKLSVIGLLALNSVSAAGETFNFIVSFFTLPVLDIQMKISEPYTIQNNSVKKIEFTTDTRPFFSKIYSVHNVYQSIYQSDEFNTLHNHKIINQGNFNQTFVASYSIEDGIANYSSGKTREVPKDIHCFFSLLMNMREMDDFSDTITVDMEGVLFQATFLVHGTEDLNIQDKIVNTEKVEIILEKNDPEQERVIDDTDIFFGNVSSDNGKRFVWLDNKTPRTIIKTKFVLSPTWLTATLVNYEK